MSTILFDRAVFGPIHSRRLGISLGINLLPTDHKICSFDCLYCECGFNATTTKPTGKMPSREEVARQLRQTLSNMTAEGTRPDVITFAGNGEPTLHPHFAEIMQDTIALRNEFAPRARVCVLSNATRLADEKVADALCNCDEAILKIDSGREETVRLLDRPVGNYSLERVVGQIVALKPRLGNRLTIQTMFTTWTDKGPTYDNTCDADVRPWLELLRQIAPPRLMIYTIDRETPHKAMQKSSPEAMERIATLARAIVANVSVSY